jgi:hypothetical protein
LNRNAGGDFARGQSLLYSVDVLVHGKSPGT